MVSPIENFFVLVSLFENNFFPVSPNEKLGSHYFFWYHLLTNLLLPASPYENVYLPLSLFENVPIFEMDFESEVLMTLRRASNGTDSL